MSAHTPGPWRVDRQSDAGRYIVVTGPDGRTVARVPFTSEWRVEQFGPHAATDAANAALIAAAPDLLAALREAFNAFAHDDDGPVWADSTIAKARAAIARAEGAP